MKIINTFNSENNLLKSILSHKLLNSRLPNKSTLVYNIPSNNLLNAKPMNSISYFYNKSIETFKNKLGGKFLI